MHMGFYSYSLTDHFIIEFVMEGFMKLLLYIGPLLVILSHLHALVCP